MKHTNPYYAHETDDRPVVVFGNMASASLARFVLEHDTPYRIAAFTVDKSYCSTPQYEGLPLIPFEELESSFTPSQARLLIPMGYQRINSVRRERFESACARGYDFVSYVSSRASHWPGQEIGKNVLVYEHAILQPFASIGDNCIIRSGAHISHHCTVEAHSFVAAEVVMGGKTVIGEQSFLGVGAVIVDSIRIAPRTFIGAGAVVTRPTEELGVYVGSPARRLPKSALDI